MSDQQAGVRVTVAAGKGEDDYFPDGHSIEVLDGHLHVRRKPTLSQAQGDVLAIYAPAMWWNARLGSAG